MVISQRFSIALPEASRKPGAQPNQKEDLEAPAHGLQGHHIRHHGVHLGHPGTTGPGSRLVVTTDSRVTFDRYG